jgi:ApaG protein
MYQCETAGVKVSVSPDFLEEHSEPDEGRYMWSYTVEIENTTDHPVQLISRHWAITDALGRTEHVQGDGVVGEQPVITPGGRFRYTSGAPLRTSSGFMTGSYEMRTDDGESFAADIPDFSLDSPYDRTSRH